MEYKILYIDDQDTSSRKKDLENLQYNVITYKPTNDFKEIEKNVRDGIHALILDYKLTEGEGEQACFDAPTVAQFVRTFHVKDNLDIPIILMSNQIIFTNNYKKDFTSQDLFDFTLTKQDFNKNKEEFGKKLNSFIRAYAKIKIDKNLLLSLGLDEDSDLHSRISLNFHKIETNVFKISTLIYEDILSSIGLTIGKDILAARLGICKDSMDFDKLLCLLKNCKYKGVFADIKERWWMDKVNDWWHNSISQDHSLRRLSAEERLELLQAKLKLDNLTVAELSKNSKSSNFWTVCKYSKQPLDPFDGVELLKDYLPWQEKEYISIDSALLNKDEFKNLISDIDKKSLRILAKNLNANG